MTAADRNLPIAHGDRYPALSDRKKIILKAIVEAHIAGGEPVGSKYILETGLLSCSSATVRNEMAELESLGYLEQPHTSSGRIPTELGYRFYVDSLLGEYAMTAREISEINTLLRAKVGELDQLLLAASRAASALTEYTGIVFRPRSAVATMVRYEILAMNEHDFVVVMITASGTVKSQKGSSQAAFTPEDAETLGRLLNEKLCGLTADEITLPIIMDLESHAGKAAPLVNPVIKCIYSVMSELDGGEVRVSGVGHLLKYPEYSDSEEFGRLLGTLESEEEMLSLVSGAAGDDVNVVIGSENNVKVMSNSSLVFKPVKKNGKTVGVIGVLGPRRMDYARVLATVEELTDNISSIIDVDRGELPSGDPPATDAGGGKK